MPQLDLLQQTALHFSQPDEKRFPALALARYALQVGGTAPTVLNAANEVAVAQFIEGKITFDRIPALVERALEVHTPRLHPSLEEVLAVDQEIRQELAYSV